MNEEVHSVQHINSFASLSRRERTKGEKGGIRRTGLHTCKRALEEVDELSDEDVHPELESDECVQKDLSSGNQVL